MAVIYSKNGHFSINILGFIAYFVFTVRTQKKLCPYGKQEICNTIQNIYGKVSIFGIYDRHLVYYQIL